MSFKTIYEKKYKILLLIPFILIVLAIIQIGVQTAVTGDFVNKGISLKGGSTITIDYDSSIDISAIESTLNQKFPLAEVSIRMLSSAGITTAVAIVAPLLDIPGRIAIA